MTTVATGQPTNIAKRPADEAGPLIVFAGGGTGGHLYPALAIRRAVGVRLPQARFVFFGTRRPIDAQVLEAANETLIEQDVQPFTVTPWRVPAFLAAWRRSKRMCRAYFAAHLPAVVIGTGGFASGPAVTVASESGLRTALLNPDLLPGRANRFLARKVDCVFTQFSQSAEHLPAGADVRAVGCPIRPAFATATRRAGIRLFNLDSDKRTLLVTGASLGARSVNRAMAFLARPLAERVDWQVLHLTGSADVADVDAAYREAGTAARTLAYTEHMAEAMAAADLIVARAGASTLAEIGAAGKPAILVPYPHHRDRHQEAQAKVIAASGAAQVLLELGRVESTAGQLGRVLVELMTDDFRLAAMGESAMRNRRGDAAAEIARQIEEWTLASAPAQR